MSSEIKDPELARVARTIDRVTEELRKFREQLKNEKQNGAPGTQKVKDGASG